MKPLPFRALDPAPLVTTCLIASVVDPELGGAVLVDPSGSEGPALIAAFLAAAGVDHVRLPVGAERSTLLGGIDVEASLRESSVVNRRGLIDAGTTLSVENLALWSPERRALLRLVVGAAGGGTRFYAVWGDAAPPPMAFLDAVAFVLPIESAVPDAARRATALARRLAAAPAGGVDPEVVRIVETARERLGGIDSDAATGALARSAAAAGVEGDRAVIHAVRAARVHAAMRDSRVVEEPDVSFARLAVLASRRGSVATPEPPRSQSPPEHAPDDAGAGAEEPDGDGRGGGGAAAEQEAAPATPPDAPALPRAPAPRRKHRRHGGGDARLAAWDRGAPERVVERRPGARRVAIADTLRHAATRGQGGPLRVRPDDLRFWRFRRRAGRLFVLAVDASGSMARHRIREAKGVVVELLGEAYRRRDRVAVVIARGNRAELLVPPTSSVARARRLMSTVPVGGGTPLASALEEIVALSARESRHGARDPVVVLLTDGRANVALRGDDVLADLEAAAARFREHRLPCVVVDTTGPFSGRDDARRLATLLGASLHPMPPGRGNTKLVEKLTR